VRNGRRATFSWPTQYIVKVVIDCKIIHITLITESTTVLMRLKIIRKKKLLFLSSIPIRPVIKFPLVQWPPYYKYHHMYDEHTADGTQCLKHCEMPNRAKHGKIEGPQSE
jgi:hypothetical protein